MSRPRRRFGQVNIVPKDIFEYNVGLIGESGVGKTTLMKEVCEKLVGREGYILLDMGREDGTKAISGVVAEKVTTFDKQLDEITGEKKQRYKHMDGVGLLDVVDDIVEYKDEYYPDLKVVVADTLDQLIAITEPYVIELYRQDLRAQGKPYQDIRSINQAYGGFMGGQSRVVEEIFKVHDKLKRVGVAFWLTGHTKLRTRKDVLVDSKYDILTTNVTDWYFNEFKTKLHFLGVLTIDRQIKTTTKDGFGGQKVVSGKIVDEKRVINFRDDNYSIDSKSRFADIEPQIEYGVDNFIKALQDAIDKERSKDVGLDTEKIEEERKEQKEVEFKAIKEAEQKRIAQGNLTEEDIVAEIKKIITESDDSQKAEIVQVLTATLQEFEVSNVDQLNIEQLQQLKSKLE